MKRLLLISFFLFICQYSFGQTGTIEGNIFDRIESRGLAFANVWLDGTKIGANTNFEGFFKIDSIPIGTYDLRISYIAYGDTTLKDLKVSKTDPIRLDLKFPPSCIYDTQGTSKKCPVCGKMDKVIPIMYGLPVGKLDRKNYYYAGCVMTYCDADWYCNRDKYKFGRMKRTNEK